MARSADASRRRAVRCLAVPADRRSCADIGRHRRRWRAEVTILPKEPSEPDGAAALADRDQLERGLRRLTAPQRTILVLTFYVGLTPSEAADALEIPVGTAKSRLHYAIEALRAAITAEERTSARHGAGGPDGMNVNRDLERQLADFYESEAPPRAPDWVLRSALETIDSTQQRRVVIRVPWRFPNMNTFAKVAVAAVVVIAVGAFGLSVLRPSGASNVGGQPTASPSPTVSPTITSAPPPSLAESFTSPRYGFSIQYPTGWVTRPATDTWTTGLPDFGATTGDVIYDPVLAGPPLDHGCLAATGW